MSALSEHEIFSKMVDGFAEAAALCEKMAISPLKGASYRRLIVVCAEIEGTCRQAGHWRENYQWFSLGIDVHDLQLRMGGWLRAHYPKAEAKKLFALAATTMRRLQRLALTKKNQKHGLIGAILPVEGPGPARQRAVQVPRVTPGGIFVPEGVTLQ